MMCHMMADTHMELIGMAVEVGLKLEWIQAEGQFNEHFDLCIVKRKRAVSLGAKEVSSKDMVRMIIRRRMNAAVNKR